MSAAPDILQLVMRSLPHGPEFRFVDRMVSLTPGVKGVGEDGGRGDEDYLGVHTPAGAHGAGCVPQEAPLPAALRVGNLPALRAVKIRGSARPGETLRMTSCRM